MRDGFRVFDADAHVLFAPDFWHRYLDRRHTSRIGSRQPFPDSDLYNPVTVDGRWTQSPRVLYGRFQDRVAWSRADVIEKYGEELIVGGFSGSRVADALASDGIDVAVVYGPEHDMWFCGIDPELQAAMARAYNRWGAEMREDSARRVHTAGPVPLNDVGRAVAEIEHAYHELGIRAFWARPEKFNGRTLGDRYYDPVWELLSELDVAFSTHDFMATRGTNTLGADRFDTLTGWHTLVHPFEAMAAIVAMICYGVFERFPRLRVGYLEAGCGWLPSWLHRIDEHLEMTAAREFPELTMSATQYFQRNCWITTEADDPHVSDVIRWLSDDHILFESDFPHPEARFPHSVETFLRLLPGEISDASRRKILWDNPLDFYRFPPEYVTPRGSGAAGAGVTERAGAREVVSP